MFGQVRLSGPARARQYPTTAGRAEEEKGSMKGRRRVILRAAGFGVAGIFPALAVAVPAVATQDRSGFDPRSIAEVIAALGAGTPRDSAEIRITAPDVAEDGRAVSIGVASSLPGTERIVILVDRNPNKVAASFTLAAGTAPAIQTRIKMHETSDVYALVRAEGGFFVARRAIRVTVGGCGL
jgi:sulfur-oxidizing protein SoxY